MKDIILPSETSDAIDLGAIDNEITGIVIPYKGNDAVGYIAYTCGEAIPWVLFNTIDNTTIVKSAKGSVYSEETLIELVKRLINDKVADNFKLINFTINLDNYNPDKLSLDAKKLMNKKNVWSL
jgi:hypothetical protein|nr:MAG TPA: hypothetical protein [Caudoviricetes sp.]